MKKAWILPGPVSNKINSSVVNYTHAMNGDVEVDEHNRLSEQREQFGGLDTVGVVENEISVYDKDNRYEV